MPWQLTWAAVVMDAVAALLGLADKLAKGGPVGSAVGEIYFQKKAPLVSRIPPYWRGLLGDCTNHDEETNVAVINNLPRVLCCIGRYATFLRVGVFFCSIAS